MRWIVVACAMLCACADAGQDGSPWTTTTLSPPTGDSGAEVSSSEADADGGTDDAPGDASSTGDTPVDFDPSFVHAQVDDALAAGVPGLAVAVVMQGEVVLAEGFGVADESGTPVDETTLFNLASVTKSAVAMTVLSLRDDGALGLSDPVPSIAPQLGLLAGHDPNTVLVRHLLTHTSGLGDWPVEPFAGADTLVDSFALNQNQPLWATPGTMWNYSNRGFELAGLVAAQASGESFADAVQTRALAPMGMHGATVDGSVAATRTHARGESGGQWVGPLDYASETYGPVTGLWAGADDLGRFARTLASGEADGIASATLAEMIEPVQVTHEWPGAHYGYGLFVDVSFDPVIVSHAGSTGGYLTDLEVIPSEGFAVVVVVNTDAWYPGAMSWAILEHYAGSPASAEVVEPLDPSSFVGTYEEPWHLGTLQVTDDGTGALSLGFVDLGATVPLEPLWGASYACTHPTDGYEMGFVFWPDAQGRALALVGRDGVAPKVD